MRSDALWDSLNESLTLMRRGERQGHPHCRGGRALRLLSHLPGPGTAQPLLARCIWVAGSPDCSKQVAGESTAHLLWGGVPSRSVLIPAPLRLRFAASVDGVPRPGTRSGTREGRGRPPWSSPPRLRSPRERRPRTLPQAEVAGPRPASGSGVGGHPCVRLAFAPVKWALAG